MYRIRTQNYRKSDPVMRWALPERVFFACGACNILAHAFLERYGLAGHEVWWSKPREGFIGHHIFIRSGRWVFDYHGYSCHDRFMAHAHRRGHRPGQDATLIELPPDVLVSEGLSRSFDSALRLREPGQFLHDALPRARAYLDRFPAPPTGGPLAPPESSTSRASGVCPVRTPRPS